MLAAILNVPSTKREWDVWSWHHRLSHSALLGAALQQRGAQLTDYVLDPINFDNVSDWLERNQQMHVDLGTLLGDQFDDLTDVDFKNPEQLQAWVYLHWLDHTTFEQRLGIGS